jgi:phenylalanyl-tRNA synthetase beta chain
VIGWFGQLHPETLETLDVEGPIAAFEIILDALPAPKSRPTRAKGKLERSEFLPVERDLAFVVGREISAADLVKAAQNAERGLVASAEVFDVYEGRGVPEGRKSVAIAVTLQPRDHTLTDAEIDAVVAKIVAEAAKKTGAVLRG